MSVYAERIRYSNASSWVAIVHKLPHIISTIADDLEPELCNSSQLIRMVTHPGRHLRIPLNSAGTATATGSALAWTSAIALALALPAAEATCAMSVQPEMAPTRLTRLPRLD